MPRLRDLEAAREQVRAACDLISVMGSYGHEFKTIAADNEVTTCPFHAESEPSLAVSVSKQVYYCYGCKEKGDVFRFVQAMDGISHVDAIRRLAEFGGVDLRPFESPASPEEREAARLYTLTTRVAQICYDQREARKFKSWRVERVFREQILAEYSVGYASKPVIVPGSEEDLESLGMGPERRNQWSDVIVVPLRNEYGQVAAFRNRPLSGAKTVAARKAYPLSVPPLYGFWEAKQAIRKSGRAIIVEGEGDVWQMRAHGYECVLAAMGSTLPDEAFAFLVERGVREVIVMPDADQAGRFFAQTVAKTRVAGLQIKIATLHDGDPDDVLLQDPTLVEQAIKTARFGIDYRVEEALDRELLTITDKLEVLEELRPVFATVTLAEEQMAARLLSERLGIDETYVVDFYKETSDETASLNDTKSERIVLAGMLVGDVFTGEATLALTSADFHLKRHQQIFEAVSTLYRDGHAVSLETVEIQLDRMAAEQAIRYLAGLKVSGNGVGPFMLEALKEKSQRRQARDVAREIGARVTNPTIPASQILQTAMSSLAKVVVGNQREPEMRTVVDSELRRIHARMQDPNVIVGLDLGTDWQSLNRSIHGLQPGRYFVFAAPSNDGKTCASVCFMSRLAIDLGTPTLALTFETGRESLIQRLIAHRSGVELEKMATGYLSGRDLELVHEAGSRIAAAPLFIEERGRVFEEAQAIIQHNIISRGVRVVFVDYIQLMYLTNNRGVARHQELGDISRGFLEIAMDTGVDIIALAQLNREGSKKGTASSHTDIGEAFKISQDADIFVSFAAKTREEIEMDGAELGNRRAIINKNRKDGPVGVSFHMMADTKVQRIYEIPT